MLPNPLSGITVGITVHKEEGHVIITWSRWPFVPQVIHRASHNVYHWPVGLRELWTVQLQTRFQKCFQPWSIQNNKSFEVSCFQEQVLIFRGRLDALNICFRDNNSLMDFAHRQSSSPGKWVWKQHECIIDRTLGSGAESGDVTKEQWKAATAKRRKYFL